MVTRKDVADRAHVSVTAVSRVLNNSGYVAKEKKEAVLKAAEDLGYRPNLIAMSLRRQRTGQILFYCRDLGNFFNIELYSGMMEYARRVGYMIVMSGTFDFEQINTMMIDGVILPNQEIANRYEKLGKQRSGLPVVAASYGVALVSQRDIPYIDCDVYVAMENALDYLNRKGHERIAFATPYTIFDPVGGGRHIAYLNRMRPIFGKDLEKYILDGYFKGGDAFQQEDFFTEGKHAASDFIRRGLDATAIVCFNDNLALGMLKQFQDMGVCVPEAVSIVGIDGTNIRRYVTPALTSVDLSTSRQGAECVRVLLDMIEGGHVRSVTSVPIGLIEGESVRDLKLK